MSTAIYNGCLRTGCFPRIWKKAKIIPIIKPDQENSDEISKFRPISLLNTAAKVMEKLLINRIMHHMHSRNLMNRNQFGFTPQTSTVDALMSLKNFVEEGLHAGQYVILVSLDVKGAFDAAWWPSILYNLKTHDCPKNLYVLTKSYFSERIATLSANNITEQRLISKGCPQGSCCEPGFWNIQYNSLLIIHLQFLSSTKVIAFADDLLILVK